MHFGIAKFCHRSSVFFPIFYGHHGALSSGSIGNHDVARPMELEDLLFHLKLWCWIIIFLFFTFRKIAKWIWSKDTPKSSSWNLFQFLSDLNTNLMQSEFQIKLS